MTTYTVSQGDTYQSTVRFDKYPSAYNTLQVSLRGSAGTFDGTALSVQDGYQISIPTTTLSTGTYNGYLYVVENGARVLLDSFQIIINPNFLTATPTAATPSFARQALAVVESQILACGNAGYLQITADGKTIQRITIDVLMKQRQELMQEIELEEQDDRINSGQPARKPVLISFR